MHSIQIVLSRISRKSPKPANICGKGKSETVLSFKGRPVNFNQHGALDKTVNITRLIRPRVLFVCIVNPSEINVRAPIKKTLTKAVNCKLANTFGSPCLKLRLKTTLNALC